MDVSVKTLDGKAAGKAALDDAIFGVEDLSLIHISEPTRPY